MAKSSQDEAEELEALVEKAEEFHGHLGPFLVLGVRMGLAGLRELKAKRGEKKLRVTAMLNYSVPVSCALDGLQVATKCTLGNKKLRLLDSSGIAAKFELDEKQIIVELNSAYFGELKKKLPVNSVPSDEVRELAKLVVSAPEKDLFTIRR